MTTYEQDIAKLIKHYSKKRKYASVVLSDLLRSANSDDTKEAERLRGKIEAYEEILKSINKILVDNRTTPPIKLT